MKNTHSSTHFLRPALLVITLATLSACASYGPAADGPVAGPAKRINGTTGNIKEIVLEIPVGDVNVIAGPGSLVSAELEIRCDERNQSCLRLAGNTTLKKQEFEHVLYISPSKRTKMAYRNSQSDYRIQVPEGTPLRIVMGYGELSVKGLRSDLTVDMKAGAVDVSAPLSAIRKVWADANFGDASVTGTDADSRDNRRLLVGAETNWEDGPGTHDIIVNLGAGDVSVNLTGE